MGSKENQAHKVNGQPDASDNQQQLWILDFVRFHHPLQGFNCNREAQGNQEHAVHQGAQDLCSNPAVRVVLGRPTGNLFYTVEGEVEGEG